MSFLKNIFKKKPGGTLVGNLLRVGVNKASGGIMGTGANMLPADSQASVNSAAADATAAIGQAYLQTPQGTALAQSTVMSWLKANWILIVLGLSAVGMAVYTFIINPKKGYKTSTNRGYKSKRKY